LLNQAGMAGWTLMATLVASAVLVLGMIGAVPAYGAAGGAAAATVSALASSALVAWALRTRAGLSTMPSRAVLSLSLAAGVLLLIAAGLIGQWVGALGLLLCLGGLGAFYAGEARRVLMTFRRRE
jgi:O-antigen/teichoic acid export membrane protein